VLFRNRLGIAGLLPILIVCCQGGSICLGAAARNAEHDDLARRVLTDTGVQGGLVVHLGCGDGKLTAALHTSDAYLVQGLETDAAKIEVARQHIQSLEECGRVSVDRFDGHRLPYVDNLVNLLVVDTRCEMRDAGSEIMRILAPRGVAVVREKGNEVWLSRIPHPKSGMVL